MLILILQGERVNHIRFNAEMSTPKGLDLKFYFDFVLCVEDVEGLADKLPPSSSLWFLNIAIFTAIK